MLAGSAANLSVTHSANLGVMDPVQRQILPLTLAVSGILYGIAKGDTQISGFALGLGLMAFAQCIFSAANLNTQTNVSRFTR